MKVELNAIDYGFPRKHRKVIALTPFWLEVIHHSKRNPIIAKNVRIIFEAFRQGKALKSNWKVHDLNNKNRKGDYVFPRGMYSSIRVIPGSDEYKIIYRVTATEIRLILIDEHDRAYKRLKEYHISKE
jgi:hypothetical protein